MSYLLEALGRGLIAHLVGAFDRILGADTDENLAELEQLAEDDPDNVPVKVRLGGRYLRADHATKARAIFEDVLVRSPESFPGRIGLACSFDATGKVEDALSHFRVAQKADPLNPAVLFCLGYCHERSGREDEATRYYQESLNVCPTLRNAHERLAAIFLRQDRIDAALEHYTTLCDLDPHQTELQLTLANLHLRHGNFQEAIARYEQALALEPDNWATHHDIVTAYEEAGLIREAIEHLHRLIEQQPDFADSRLRLGDLYSRVGNDEAATDNYQRAVDMAPDYLEAHVKLGTQHLRAGRYDLAARWFSSALEINDRLLSAYVGIGVAQHAAGHAEDALASFEMARNIEPNSTLLFSEVARMHLKAAASRQSNRFLIGPSPIAPADSHTASDLLSQQIDRLREAAKRNPNHADIHYRLGLLLRNRGQIEDAVGSFQLAVKINPTYMKALIKLGLALGELDRTDDAIEVLRQATEIRPDYLDLHYQLGLLFAQRCQFDMAVEHFDRAVAGNPTNVAFQANLALALQNMGLIDRAQATWQIVTDLEPDSVFAEQARAAMAEAGEQG